MMLYIAILCSYIKQRFDEQVLKPEDRKGKHEKVKEKSLMLWSTGRIYVTQKQPKLKPQQEMPLIDNTIPHIIS